jgi:hypothetical protein
VVEGEACDEEEDACVYAQCKGGKCVPLPGLGDDCEWLGKGCGAGYCGEADVCEPGNQEGGNCLFYDECAAGLACAGDVCLPLRTAGEPCSDDWECDTIFCDGGTCSAMLDPENSCLAGCIAGTRKCEGTTVMECADDGSAFAEVEECGEGMGCTAGQCVACESHAYTGCHDGNAWWFNGCDNPEELAEECSYDEVCEYGECTEPEPSCELYDCDSEGFGYTCGSGSYQINYSYCSNGNVSGVSVDYGNGHTVWCTFDCSGWGGSCNDDTGASCYF